MDFLMRKIGPLPLWGYVAVVVIGGVAFYIWWRHNMASNANNAATQAQSTSGVAGANPAYNPLNPTNDPNIDPNTGVPYQIEEGTNPNTGLPNYYNQPGSPTSSPSTQPTTPTTPAGQTIVSTSSVGAGGGDLHLTQPAPFQSTVGGQTLSSGAVSYGSNTNSQFNATGEQIPTGGKGYTFEPTAGTGQTNHLWNVAIQEYGVQGTQAVNAATQAIINANPSLSGKPYTYQPPAGTRIVIPQL